MAYFDAQRSEAVLRIVYDGPATAGKTANLRSLHAAFSQRSMDGIHVPAENARGRTLFFDWLELLVGHVDEWPLRCQILTVPGQLALAKRRVRLLKEVDAVVLVCDSTPKGVAAARIAATSLVYVLGHCGNTSAPVIVQANKQDLAGALAPRDVALRLGMGAHLRVVPARATEGEGVRETLIAALDAARDRLRPLLRAGGPTALSCRTETAEQLYLTMLAEDETDDDVMEVTALEVALKAVEELVSADD